MALPLQVAGERIGVQVLRASPGHGFLVPDRLDVFLHQPVDLVVLQPHVPVAGPQVAALIASPGSHVAGLVSGQHLGHRGNHHHVPLEGHQHNVGAHRRRHLLAAGHQRVPLGHRVETGHRQEPPAFLQPHQNGATRPVGEGTQGLQHRFPDPTLDLHTLLIRAHQAKSLHELA